MHIAVLVKHIQTHIAVLVKHIQTQCTVHAHIAHIAAHNAQHIDSNK